MKNFSIKLKITVWFAASMLIITGLTMGSVIGICGSVIKKNTFDDLMAVIEENSDEVEFFENFSELYIDDDYDVYLSFKGGYIEIDDDFVRSVNGIKCSVFDDTGAVLYGDDSLRKLKGTSEFIGDGVKTVRDDDKNTYYYFDKKITLANNETLWLRGVVSADYGTSSVSNIIRISVLILPLLVFFSILGGYLIAAKLLSPISEIAGSAESIREGNDLTKRIDLSDKSSEVVSLSKSFNGMLSRLEGSFKAEQQLTSDVSHELRTPVSVIMAQCEFALEKDRTVEEYEDALRLILRQSRGMSSMINDMLYFSRLERTEKSRGLSEINLSEAVLCVCEDMSLIRDKNIELKHDIEKDIMIRGDIELISRLVVNLISNAYRYGKENGSITVELKAENNIALLSVKDNGIGIAKEDISKIWNRFYRVDKSRSKKGSGLGLNFVKEIARIHGADVSVESEPGKGSVFTVGFDTVHTLED